jgi:hypothetical protein
VVEVVVALPPQPLVVPPLLRRRRRRRRLRRRRSLTTTWASVCSTKLLASRRYRMNEWRTTKIIKPYVPKTIYNVGCYKI